MWTMKKSKQIESFFGQQNKLNQFNQTILERSFPQVQHNEQVVHVPIWYVFKNGYRIDLNDPSQKHEDFTGEFERVRKLGVIKINEWKKLVKNSPKGGMLALPEIVFYE